jgi:hypothetical protein
VTELFNKIADILIDVPKEYDTVWNAELLYKLHTVGLQDFMILLIISYLNGRKFRDKPERHF